MLRKYIQTRLVSSNVGSLFVTIVYGDFKRDVNLRRNSTTKRYDTIESLTWTQKLSIQLYLAHVHAQSLHNVCWCFVLCGNSGVQ